MDFQYNNFNKTTWSDDLIDLFFNHYYCYYLMTFSIYLYIFANFIFIQVGIQQLYKIPLYILHLFFRVKKGEKTERKKKWLT